MYSIYMYINRKSTVHMYMYMYIDFHKQLESRNEGAQFHYKNSCFREDISYVCTIETIPLPTYSCVYILNTCIYIQLCIHTKYMYMYIHVQSCIYIQLCIHTKYMYMYIHTTHRVMNTQYSVGYSSPVNVCCYLRPHLILIAALVHGGQLLGLALGGGPAGVVLELPASIVCGVRLVLLLLLLLLLLWRVAGVCCPGGPPDDFANHPPPPEGTRHLAGDSSSVVCVCVWCVCALKVRCVHDVHTVVSVM